MFWFFLSLLVNYSAAALQAKSSSAGGVRNNRFKSMIFCETCKEGFPCRYSKGFVKNKRLEEKRNLYTYSREVILNIFPSFGEISNTVNGKIFGAKVYDILQSIDSLEPRKLQSVQYYFSSQTFHQFFQQYESNKYTEKFTGEQLCIVWKDHVIELVFSDIWYLKKLFRYPDLFTEAFSLRKEVVETLVEELDPKNAKDYMFLNAVIGRVGINFRNEVVGTLWNAAIRKGKDNLSNFLIKEGADMNSQNIVGQLPFLQALRYQDDAGKNTLSIAALVTFSRKEGNKIYGFPEKIF